ncbi:uncharacterized protein LOC130297676 [Hyla sarda]|uniref:uncharacterized protein LOC130297676 n=1 Tax=Hyla sarda TaxID=327740 RepID=UPI0024C3CA78|nr:uncharacterized protein LOC130297676 [Hyla sarda]
MKVTALIINGKKLEPSKAKVCGIVRKIIGILNKAWKGYFIIDPSGDKKLLWKSIGQINADCLEIYLNLVVGDSEVFSEQTHDEMPGNGISLLKDYINTMLLADNYLTKLNKKMEEKNLQLSPDELQKLLPDVHETDPTSLILTITEMPQLNSNNENEMMTVKAKLQGYASKSDKSVFDVLFETNVKIHPEINNNKLELQFLSCGDPDIHDWESSIGHSGDLDTKNLEILIKKLNSGTLLGALKGLGIRLGIPFWNLGPMVEVKTETIEIIPEET